MPVGKPLSNLHSSVIAAILNFNLPVELDCGPAAWWDDICVAFLAIKKVKCKDWNNFNKA